MRLADIYDDKKYMGKMEKKLVNTEGHEGDIECHGVTLSILKGMILSWRPGDCISILT